MPAVRAGWSGQSRGWRYIAQRHYGSGSGGPILHNEVPLHDVQMTDVLSGPPQFTATIEPALRALKGSDGLPLLSPWNTVIHAEAEGEIRGSFLVVGQQFNGPTLSLDCTGFTSFLQGRYWPGVTTYRQVEPLQVVRDIYTTIQSHWGSNLGIVVDSTTMTGAKLGAPLVPTTATTTTSAGTVAEGEDSEPYVLAWYETHDLAAEIDQLASDFGFEYHERHAWNAAKTDVNHYLDFGYPAWGRRRHGLRFILGENIETEVPISEDGDEFANHVVVLGAGEGTAMIRGEAAVQDGRIRRMAVVSDDTITTKERAIKAARLELARRNQMTKIDNVMIRNKRGLAQLGSFGVGDEIEVQAESDWKSYKAWHRVTSLTITPDNPDLMGAALVRSDWV